jgi:hypothetical protein
MITEIFSNRLKNLGEFEVTGEKMLVTDPCYELGSDGQLQLENIKNGTWKAVVFKYSKPPEPFYKNRVISLLAYHKDESYYGDWKQEKETVFVDSGMMSIGSEDFSVSFPMYKRELTKEEAEFQKFSNYDEVCDLVLESKYSGAICKNGAVVSHSGHGDGSYPVYVLRKNNKICAVAVQFMELDNV